jgi:hypothetical protein
MRHPKFLSLRDAIAFSRHRNLRTKRTMHLCSRTIKLAEKSWCQPQLTWLHRLPPSIITKNSSKQPSRSAVTMPMYFELALKSSIFDFILLVFRFLCFKTKKKKKSLSLKLDAKLRCTCNRSRHKVIDCTNFFSVFVTETISHDLAHFSASVRTHHSTSEVSERSERT